MKRILTILFCSAAIMSFAGNDEKTQSANAQEPQTEHCIHIDAETFIKKVADINQAEWKYLGDRPAIVDFYADWCGPCRKLSPLLEEIAAEYKNDIIIYKVNVDKEPDLATAFGIRSLPTLFFVPMQGNPSIVEGFLPKEELYKAMNATILKEQQR